MTKKKKRSKEKIQTFRFYALPGKEGRRLRSLAGCKKHPQDCEERRIMALAHAIWKVIKVVEKKWGRIDSWVFSNLIFGLCRDLAQEGLKLPLPYYWFIHGVHIEYETLNTMLNKVGYGVEVVLK